MRGNRYQGVLVTAVLACCVLFQAEIKGEESSPLGREFDVSTGSWPAVVALTDGDFVICWQGQVADSGWGVYCQRFGPEGSRRGAEFRAHTVASARHTEPALAALPDGGFVVCWHSYCAAENQTDVWAQRFAADGNSSGVPFRVNTYTSGFQQRAAVAPLEDGGFVVCWQSHDQDGWEDGVFAQRFLADGSKVGPEFQVHSCVEGDEELVQVAPLADGGFSICWHRSWAPDGSHSREDILLQRFDALGEKQGPEIEISVGGVAPFARPALSALRDGSVVVCWAGLPYHDYQDIRGKRLEAEGAPLGAEFCANSPAAAVWNLEPAVTTLRNGDFVVCWRRWPRTGGDGLSRCDIFARRFAPDGTPRGREFRLNARSEFGSLPNLPSVAPVADSGFVACWQMGGGGIRAVCCLADSVAPASDSLPAPRPAAYLAQNHPNPFNTSTHIRWWLPPADEPWRVAVKIYNLCGQEVKTIAEAVLPPGAHTATWDGVDACGRSAPSGVYLCQLEAGGAVAKRKILLVR